MCQGKDLKGNEGMALGLVDSYQGGGACHYCVFGGAPKYFKNIDMKIPRSGSARCKKNMIPSWQTTHGLWYYFLLVGNPFLANGCSKSNKVREWGREMLQGQISGKRFYPNLQSGLQ
jgi:hypothetical protein